MGARACHVFCWSWGRCQRWPCGCGAEGFRVFFYSSSLFSRTSSATLRTPLFLSWCFSLLCAFFLGLGATQPCTCVFGQLAFNPSFLGSFCKNTVFPLKRGYHCSFLSVSLFFSLASFTFPFHSLSLYLYFLFIVFFVFPCFSLFSPLFFCCFSCLVSLLCFTKETSKYYICCAAKVAERKKTKNNPFFHLKIS